MNYKISEQVYGGFMKYLTLFLLVFALAGAGCNKKKKSAATPPPNNNIYQGYYPNGFVTPINGRFFQGLAGITNGDNYKGFLEEAYDFENYTDEELNDYLDELVDEPAYIEVQFTSNTTAVGKWHAGVYQINNGVFVSEVAIPFEAVVTPIGNGQLRIQAGPLEFITSGTVNNWSASYEGNPFATALVH